VAGNIEHFPLKARHFQNVSLIKQPIGRWRRDGITGKSAQVQRRIGEHRLIVPANHQRSIFVSIFQSCIASDMIAVAMSVEDHRRGQPLCFQHFKYALGVEARVENNTVIAARSGHYVAVFLVNRRYNRMQSE